MYNNIFCIFYCNLLKNLYFFNYIYTLFMAKKLKGEQFYLSANDLISGDVIYLAKNKWREILMTQ